MAVSLSDVESRQKNKTMQEDVYSGEATFLYSSKIDSGVNVAKVCEALTSSDVFSFALNVHGQLYFSDCGRPRAHPLNIENTISGLGMTVSGHEEFIKSNPGDSNTLSLLSALNLFLSENKLFNADFGFPAESARIFMRPIAVRTDGTEEHEVIVPCFRVYSDGIISVSLSPVLGFEDKTVFEVVDEEVNKSRRNVNSVLCERALYLAFSETQISKLPLQERVVQRKGFEATVRSALEAPQELEFLDERLTVYELVHTDQLTLADIARNMLSVVARAVALGAVRTHINWFSRKYRDDSIGKCWYGKPIIYIRSHTRQKKSSTENWATHKRLVNSVMSRVPLSDVVTHADFVCSDMRSLDDFNSFYSEAVSLMLSSAQVEQFIEQNNSYTFNNLASDIQVLNEASHYMQIYYAYASLGLERCKKTIDVARLELKILSFEESLLSAYKYGEIANYLDEVKRGDHLTTICKLLRKKIEIVHKALELDEKIASETYTRRITIIFGIIASATLSPELMQPLAKIYGIPFADEQVGKIIGIGASVVVVVSVLASTYYMSKFFKWIARKLKV